MGYQLASEVITEFDYNAFDEGASDVTMQLQMIMQEAGTIDQWLHTDTKNSKTWTNCNWIALNLSNDYTMANDYYHNIIDTEVL